MRGRIGCRHSRAMENEPYVLSDSGELDAPGEAVNNCQAEKICRNEMQCDTIHLEVEDVNRKRSRAQEGSSSEEGWQTISRGHKIVRRYSQEVEKEVQVLASCSSPMPKQFALARLFKSNNIKGVSRVKYVHQFKILVTFEESIEAERFIQCKAFCDLGWRCQKTSEVGISFGIIRDIDLDIKEEDIMKNVTCDVEIIYAKRLNKRIYDESRTAGWVQCEAVRLAFRGPSLPPYVSIYGMRVNVVPYVFPVTQCSRCWKFGHTRLLCPSKKVVCPKCTKSHENCETTSFRCVNCTGDHMALQKICPVYKKERRIRELMSEFNCTYRKALTLYVPPSPAPVNQIPQLEAFEEVERAEKLKQQGAEHAVEETAYTGQKEKLMSQLFTGSEQSSFKPLQKRKIKKLQKRPPTPASSPASIPLPMDTTPNEESECTEEETHTKDEGYKKKGKTNAREDIGFIKMLSRLYRVVMSSDSLEVRIHKGVKIFTEWLLSLIVSYVSVDSLFNILSNDEQP